MKCTLWTLRFVSPLLFLSSLYAAQVLSCSATAVPLVVRAEGVTERMGDISLICNGGQAFATVTGNFTLYLSVPLTNRIAAGNVTDVQFTYDDGAGPQPVGAKGYLAGASVSFDGASFPLASDGSVSLRPSCPPAKTSLPRTWRSMGRICFR